MNAEHKEEIVRLICQSEENLEFVFTDYIADIKNHLINEILLPQLIKLCEKFKLSHELQLQKHDWMNMHQARFVIRKPSWRNDSKIVFQWERRGLKSFWVGITYKKNKEIHKELKQRVLDRKLDKNWKSENGSVWKNYNDWGKDEMVKIKSGDMVNAFEKDIKIVLDLTKGFDKEL
jgi:hypothetical protein